MMQTTATSAAPAVVQPPPLLTTKATQYACWIRRRYGFVIPIELIVAILTMLQRCFTTPEGFAEACSLPSEWQERAFHNMAWRKMRRAGVPQAEDASECLVQVIFQDAADATDEERKQVWGRIVTGEQ